MSGIQLQTTWAKKQKPPTAIEVLIDYSYCSATDEALCVPRSRRFVIPVTVGPPAEGPAPVVRELADAVGAPKDD